MFFNILLVLIDYVPFIFCRAGDGEGAALMVAAPIALTNTPQRVALEKHVSHYVDRQRYYIAILMRLLDMIGKVILAFNVCMYYCYF